MPVPEHLAAAPCEHGVELDMCDTYGCAQEYNRLAEEHTPPDPCACGTASIVCACGDTRCPNCDPTCEET